MTAALVLALMMGCATRLVHVPVAVPIAIPIPVKTVCLWPDPIVFTLNDDSWPVCFQIETPGVSPLFRCATVAELRRLSYPLFAQ